MKFKNWLYEQLNTLGTEEVDEREIDAAYDKSQYAVDLVKMYDLTLPKEQRLLPNISVIGNLSKNPNIFGLINNAENKKVISGAAQEKIRFKFGEDVFASGKIHRIPEVVIKKYIPDINPNEIQQSDVIRVDVRNILRRYGDTPEAIIEIASTIVHECTHELEIELTGTTRDGPGSGVEKAEKKFKSWVEKNKARIAVAIPQIGLKP